MKKCNIMEVVTPYSDYLQKKLTLLYNVAFVFASIDDS